MCVDNACQHMAVMLVHCMQIHLGLSGTNSYWVMWATGTGKVCLTSLLGCTASGFLHDVHATSITCCSGHNTTHRMCYLEETHIAVCSLSQLLISVMPVDIQVPALSEPAFISCSLAVAT